MFNDDWFHGEAFHEQRSDARLRCANGHFSQLAPEDREKNEEYVKYRDELEVRTLVYLRDGFSYELKEMANVTGRSHLTFECEPVDDQYKVGAFVVAVLFDEIVRVEVFAVHPSEKPSDLPQITGFRSQPDRGDHGSG